MTAARVLLAIGVGLGGLSMASPAFAQAAGTAAPAAAPASSATAQSPSVPNADLAYGAYQRLLFGRAFAFAVAAAEAGERASMTLLGLLYENGEGVPRDAAKAASWYEIAATRGDREAMFRLGILHLDGRGVTKDERQAATWFAKAADLGQPEAMYNLGLLHISGLGGVKVDLERAADLFTRAATAGNIDARYGLAKMAEAGEGLLPDPKVAAEHMRLAAEGGHIAAQVEYGLMLFNARGTARDERKGAAWLARAAQAGNPVAQNRVARLYAYGISVDPSIEDALKWHYLGKLAGIQDPRLDEYEARQDEKSRVAGLDAALAWTGRARVGAKAPTDAEKATLPSTTDSQPDADERPAP
jgi:hypothetical protein